MGTVVIRKKSGRRSERARLGGPESGAAYVEFIIAFIPLFTLFLGTVQMTQLYIAALVVDHAAYRAVRAASVIMDDDPRYYRGEGRNEIGGGRIRQDDITNQMRAAGVGAGAAASTSGGIENARSRLANVELAAAMVLLPLASTTGQDSVMDALGSSGIEEAAQLTVDRMDLELTDPPLTGRTIDEYTAGVDMLQVTIRYSYECTVPVVRQLVCSGGSSIIERSDSLPNQRAQLIYVPGNWGQP